MVDIQLVDVDIREYRVSPYWTGKLGHVIGSRSMPGDLLVLMKGCFNQTNHLLLFYSIVESLQLDPIEAKLGERIHTSVYESMEIYTSPRF